MILSDGVPRELTPAELAEMDAARDAQMEQILHDPMAEMQDKARAFDIVTGGMQNG